MFVSLFQGSLLVIVIMIDNSKKCFCEGGFWTSVCLCSWKAQSRKPRLCYFLSGTQNILSNNVLYIIVVFLKVSDCKKVDLNAQKLPKFGKHNFLTGTSEVPEGVCRDISMYFYMRLQHKDTIIKEVMLTQMEIFFGLEKNLEDF